MTVANDIAEINAHAFEGVLTQDLGSGCGEIPPTLDNFEVRMAGRRSIEQQPVRPKVVCDVEFREVTERREFFAADLDEIVVEVAGCKREGPAVRHLRREGVTCV